MQGSKSSNSKGQQGIKVIQ